MKLTILFIVALCASRPLFSQPQPQGEFHQALIKKQKDEIGVIIFSKKEIPRLGKSNEIEPLLTETFLEGDSFWGRVFLHKHLGALEGGMPKILVYRLVVSGNNVFEMEIKDDYLPVPEWSSWMLQLPADLQKGFQRLPSGESEVALEIWNGKPNKSNADKPLAVGKFFFKK
jgi:hypothetical protein